MNARHDPYITPVIEAIGVEATIIALQHAGAKTYRQYEFCRVHPRLLFRLTHASDYLNNSTWYYRNARILMGVE